MLREGRETISLLSPGEDSWPTPTLKEDLSLQTKVGWQATPRVRTSVALEAWVTSTPERDSVSPAVCEAYAPTPG